MPNLLELKLEELAELDEGRVSRAFMHELKRAVLDCQDRPGDKNKRKVCLEFELEPLADESGLCETVNGNFKITSKVPVRKSKPYQFGVRRGGQLVFNKHDAASVDQATIFDGEDDDAQE